MEAVGSSPTDSTILKGYMFKALLLTAFLFSCAPTPIDVTYPVENEFVEYVQRFEERCGVHSNSGIIFTDSFTPDHASLCANYGRNNPANVIYVNRKYWMQVGDADRELLITHELGHCVLDRRHEGTLTTVGPYPNAPKSVMYPMPMGWGQVFVAYGDYYYNELCGVRTY